MYTPRWIKNMQNVLKTILNTLNEAEDDLFPGFTSSAFDEHKASKNAPVTVDSIHLALNRISEATKVAVKRANAFKKDIYVAYTWGSGVRGPTDEALTEQPWIDKYPITKEKFAALVVDTADPRLEQKVAAMESIFVRLRKYEDMVKKLKSKLSRVRKKEAEDTIKAAASTPRQKIDPMKIPRRFSIQYRDAWKATPSNHHYDNPYFEAVQGTTAFAGHPLHFTKWVGKLRTTYFELSRLIKQLGYPELNIMYANTDAYDVTDFYLTNQDDSVIIANRKKVVHVYIKNKKFPNQKYFTHFRGKTISSHFIRNIEQQMA
jgi:hypothetical protein